MNFNKFGRYVNVDGFILDMNNADDRDDFLYCLSDAKVSYVMKDSDDNVVIMSDMYFDYDTDGDFCGFYQYDDPFAYSDWMSGYSDDYPSATYYSLLYK